MALYAPGDLIGKKYLVHETLEGGMGEVFLCTDINTPGLPLALKTVKCDDKYLQDFREEVRKWIALDRHPNIVQCFTLYEADRRLFMVLERVDGDKDDKKAHDALRAAQELMGDQPFGGLVDKEEILAELQQAYKDKRRGNSLRTWLKNGPLSVEDALDAVVDICRGLLHMHEKQPGLVHCDLKPENVLIDRHQVAKITDFGLAHVFSRLGMTLNEHDVHDSGKRGGTEQYMAPEQWMEKRLDVRTDIYAIGCILYELLTTSFPYEAKTIPPLCRLHLEAPIPRVPDQDQINQIIVRCMAKSPDERYSSPEILLKDLEAAHRMLCGRGLRSMPPNLSANNALYDALRGDTFRQLGDYDQALEACDYAVAKSSEDWNGYAYRYRIYRELGRNLEAYADYAKIAQLVRKYPERYEGEGWLFYEAMLPALKIWAMRDIQSGVAPYSKAEAEAVLEECERALAASGPPRFNAKEVEKFSLEQSEEQSGVPEDLEIATKAVMRAATSREEVRRIVKKHPSILEYDKLLDIDYVIQHHLPPDQKQHWQQRLDWLCEIADEQ